MRKMTIFISDQCDSSWCSRSGWWLRCSNSMFSMVVFGNEYRLAWRDRCFQDLARKGRDIFTCLCETQFNINFEKFNKNNSIFCANQTKFIDENKGKHSLRQRMSTGQRELARVWQQNTRSVSWAAPPSQCPKRICEHCLFFRSPEKSDMVSRK